LPGRTIRRRDVLMCHEPLERRVMLSGDAPLFPQLKVDVGGRILDFVTADFNGDRLPEIA